jgi:hypothetical protein
MPTTSNLPNRDRSAARSAMNLPRRSAVRQLHRHGNEAAWLANQQIAPIEVAKELSETPLFGGEVRPARPRDVPDSPAAK